MSYHKTSVEIRAKFAEEGRKRFGGEFCLDHRRIFTLERFHFRVCLLPMISFPFTPFPIKNVQAGRSTLATPITQSLKTMHMVDANNGWAVGSEGANSIDITRERRA